MQPCLPLICHLQLSYHHCKSRMFSQDVQIVTSHFYFLQKIVSYLDIQWDSRDVLRTKIHHNRQLQFLSSHKKADFIFIMVIEVLCLSHHILYYSIQLTLDQQKIFYSKIPKQKISLAIRKILLQQIQANTYFYFIQSLHEGNILVVIHPSMTLLPIEKLDEVCRANLGKQLGQDKQLIKQQLQLPSQKLYLKLQYELKKLSFMHPKVYRTYSYVIFGPEKVGKANIITRFTKDQFTQIHNLTMENQQTAILNLDGRTFQVNLFDTAGISEITQDQKSMESMKTVWRHNKDGFIFTFAINNAESYQSVINEIRQLKQKSIHSNVAIILVGNKTDLEHERKIPKRTAMNDANILGIKYFEVSAKSSPKQQIDALIYQLIETNEMQKFNVSSSTKSAFQYWFRCDGSPCCIM